MKKQLLSLFAASLSLVLAAQTSSPVVEWGKLIDGSTSAGDQSTDVTVDRDGNVYWYGTYGTTESAPDVNYDGEYLYTGALYNAGTSQNGNFTLLKTDSNGNKLWAVYSNSGDFASNVGGSALTSDGGVVVAGKVRHTDGMTDRNLSLTDASGKETVVEWTCERRYYRMMVTKISADGEIVWNRMIDFSTEPGPEASGNYAEFWAESFNLGSVAVDDYDNIYLAINYKNPVTIGKADGSSVTLVPENNKKWTGDPQTSCGDFLLLGLDSDGYYRNSLTLEGTASVAYCQKVIYANGKVYAQGYVTGDGSELKAGDKTLVPTEVMSPLVLCADTDLVPVWAKCFPGEKVQSKNGFQNCGLKLVNGALWFVGQYNLKFSDPDNPELYVSSSQGTLREGFVVKLNASDGSWLASRNSRDDEFCQGGAFAKTGLTGYMSVIANPEKDDFVYVLGYVLNANVGVFMRRYNANTLEADLSGEYNIVTAGGSPSFQAAAYDGPRGVCYLTARGNRAFTMFGGEESDAPSGWGVLATKVKLPAGMTTGASEVEISPDATLPEKYYTLQGIEVSNPSHGVYIRRQGNKVSKVVL